MSSKCTSILRFSVIFLFLILFTHLKNDVAAKKACGKALTQLLADYCVDGFNHRFKRCLEQEAIDEETVAPRDGPLLNYIKDILRNVEEKQIDSAPENMDNHPENNSEKILVRKRKQTNYNVIGGVAEECCSVGCVYGDILKYCINDEIVPRPNNTKNDN